MAWIESHDNLGQHPKVYALSTALNADIATSIGVLHLLWHFTLKFAWRDGDLSRFDPAAIARSIGWDKDPKKLIQALQATGWLDELVVHDWMDYAGRIVKDRLYNDKRRKTSKNDVPRRKIGATVPNRTVPNTTLQNYKDKGIGARVAFAKPTAQEATEYARSIGYRLSGQAFVDHYEARGWKYNGGVAMKDWKAAIRTWKRRDPQNIIAPPPKPREPERELTDEERREASAVFGQIKKALVAKEMPK